LSDALQTLFIADLLTPSSPLWIITPWVSDVAVIDNRTGRFTGLLPDMPKRPLRLGEVLKAQMQRGGKVVIASRPDEHNRSFAERLADDASAAGVRDQLMLRYSIELHEKGILTQRVLLSGSMNLTYNGLRRLEESILITDGSDAVARARIAYEDRWSSP
jgi:hypothetical protein